MSDNSSEIAGTEIGGESNGAKEANNIDDVNSQDSDVCYSSSGSTFHNVMGYFADAFYWIIQKIF